MGKFLARFLVVVLLATVALGAFSSLEVQNTLYNQADLPTKVVSVEVCTEVAKALGLSDNFLSAPLNTSLVMTAGYTHTDQLVCESGDSVTIRFMIQK